MSSDRARNQRIYVEVGVCGIVLFLNFAFFAFMLGVAMKCSALASFVNESLVLGAVAWLYCVNRQTETSGLRTGKVLTPAEALINVVSLLLLSVSGIGLFFPSMQAAAMWCNVFISFLMLVVYSFAARETIKRQISLFKLK